MVKPYRIKHKASGYFYQRYNGSNLGKKGKVYMNNQSPLTMCDNENFIRIQIRHNTLAYKALKDMLAKYIIGKDDECEYHSTSYRVPKSEFKKEELQRMKKISFSLKYLITKYDWCFYFIPSLIVWKPYSGVYEINVAFLLWEFNIKYQLKRKKK